MREGQEIGGKYLYCVINSGAEFCFDNIGIEDNKVYTIPYNDFAAVVHSCEARPYDTKDGEKAKEWVLAHNYVIDRATNKFGTVLPFSFDCLIRGDNETIKNWLAENYEKLKRELERVRNKSEYSVQIFCYQDKLVEKLASNDQKLKAKIEKMSKGAAYLIQRKFELKMKDAIAVEISMLADDFDSKIREHVEESKVEKKTAQVPEKYKGMKLIVALSCLAHKDKVEKLGEVLDEINKREGFAVRFTGPWAPFSFVRLKED